jgi:putative DNA primase/helicase
MWRCPGHDDRTPSLSVHKGANGRVLLKCHGGCPTEKVVAALGLTMADLFDDRPHEPLLRRDRQPRANGDLQPKDHQEPRLWSIADDDIAAVHVYADPATNAALFEVCRLTKMARDRGQPKCLPRHRGTDGQVYFGLGSWLGRVPPLYREAEAVAELQQGGTAYITEGERDADVIHEIGGVACTNVGGAGKFRPEHAATLATALEAGAPQARMVVVAHRDLPGMGHASDVLRKLVDAGAPPDRISIVQAAEGKDAADHISAGRRLEELVQVKIDAGKDAPWNDQPDAEAAASPTSDVANDHRLARHFGGELRWTEALGWIAWEGTHWEPSETGALARAARLGRIIQAEGAEKAAAASKTESSRDRDRLREEAEALQKWARESEREPRVRAALNLARPALEMDAGQLDAKPFLLNCANGTVDLRTGELQPHSRSDYLTKSTGIVFDPGATSDLWDRVVRHAVPDDEERSFLQKAAGYSASGEKREDVVFLLHGITRTAKGTIQAAIATALGDYAGTANLEAFAQRAKGVDGSRARPELAKLRGLRMVSIYESGRSLRLDSALLKTISGSDPIAARDLYRAEFTFQPQLALWIATNSRPRLPEDDDAVWQRIRELPFLVHIPEAERDPEVRRRLSDPNDCGPAVLAWVVTGFEMYRRDGLRPPEIVRNATTSYRAEMDRLAPFLAACCVLSDNAWIKTSELRGAYETWCKENGETPLMGRAWGETLARHGCKASRVNAGRGWSGICLVAWDGHDA